MATTTKKETISKGIRTTEFWLSLCACAAGFCITAGLADPDGAGTWDKVVGVICSLLAAMGYTVARTKVKVAAEENK